jgi:hypothetical protein
VGPRAGLDGYEKSHPPLPLDFETRTVQPVAIRYTDYTVPATNLMNMASQNDKMTTVNKVTDYKKLRYRRKHAQNTTDKEKNY